MGKEITFRFPLIFLLAAVKILCAPVLNFLVHRLLHYFLPEDVEPRKFTLAVFMPGGNNQNKAFSNFLFIRKYYLNGRKLVMEGLDSPTETNAKNVFGNPAVEPRNLKIGSTADETVENGKDFNSPLQ